MGSTGASDFTSVRTKTVDYKLKNDASAMDIGLFQRKTVGAILGKPETVPKLFTPFQIRGQTFQNRILVSPMCMYACERQDGILTDFHLGHYGNLSVRGPSLVFVEASAVEPEGRLSPQDAGLWGEQHVEPLRRIANLVHASGSKLGIQLAHGGRKAGLYPPYHNFEENGGKLSRNWGLVPESEGGFGDLLVGPSPIPWTPEFPVPKELTISEIKEIIQKFADAARRAVEAGVDVIELHGAHGYLLHEFLSGNTNKRTDIYGGSLENRLRFVLELITAVRAVIPKTTPLFLRVSGTDYTGGDHILSLDPSGWDIQQVIELCRRAVPLGLDVIDVSSGANVPGARGPIAPDFGFQVPLAEEVKKAEIEGLLVAAVGGMDFPKLSEQVLKDERADLILVGRGFIRDPSFVYTAARELGVQARWASQYSWMWPLNL